MLFLYPKHAQSDTISSYHEDDTFYEHLKIMFPPDGVRPSWDEKGEYTPDNLSVYLETKKKRLLKVGKKMTLADVFTRAGGNERELDGLELKAGCLHAVVLPRGTVESEWVEQFKIRRDQV